MIHDFRSLRGSTIVEFLVALTVFAIFAGALAQTLITAQGARRTGAHWMHATQLAVERLERWRAGDRSTDPTPIDGFTRTWESQAVAGYEQLQRVDVTVTWDDQGQKQFTLPTLALQVRVKQFAKLISRLYRFLSTMVAVCTAPIGVRYAGSGWGISIATRTSTRRIRSRSAESRPPSPTGMETPSTSK